MAVGTHPKPTLKKPTDAVLRVTASGICGSDLHMYDGRTALKKGNGSGHEIMGVIEEVGEAGTSIKKGDRVALPFNIACGFCANCHRGHTHACPTMNPTILARRTGMPERDRTRAGKRSSYLSRSPTSIV